MVYMNELQVSPQEKLSKVIPPIRTIITGAILVLLVWLFFTKKTMQFYASIVFFFYSLTHSMWISVVLLGVTQTLLMIPFRIINITKNKHIKDFEGAISEEKDERAQTFLLKKSTRTGNKIILYYLVNFMVELTSYVSIGRLFLTDFYTKKLDPSLLYSFVKYPSYPIQDVWFKIPYPKFLNTYDLGISRVLLAWAVIIIGFFVFKLIQSILLKQNIKIPEKITAKLSILQSGSILILFILVYLLIRNFPKAIGIGIYTGDVSKPLPSFNTITAIVTFATLFWLDIPTILKKGEIAKEANIDPAVIRKTQSQLFGESLRSASIVGLGAYFITNQIPCAFELSIFTLEIISLVSPLTLDRIILNSKLKG